MDSPEKAKHPVGERLLEARRARNMDQTTAAKRLHLTHGTLSRYESGLRWPGLDTLLLASQIYGQPLSYFTGDGIYQADSLLEGFDTALLDTLRIYPPAAQRALADYLPALSSLIEKVCPTL